jgi:hypothetical protein
MFRPKNRIVDFINENHNSTLPVPAGAIIILTLHQEAWKTHAVIGGIARTRDNIGYSAAGELIARSGPAVWGLLPGNELQTEGEEWLRPLMN